MTKLPQENNEITHVVKDSKRGNDSVDKVDASQAAGPVRDREEGHQAATDDSGVKSVDKSHGIVDRVCHLRRDDASNNESPTMGLHADTESDKEREENADSARRCVHQSRLLRIILKATDEGGRIGCDDTARNGQLKRDTS
jgi:hypothetical protein